MKNLEKRIQNLEELIFGAVLQTRAETMAVRDILLEKELVSPERWEELVEDHKTSFSSFKAVAEMEGKHKESAGQGSTE
ncbi:MAG: hypothetical protein JRH07_16610 [Deltaproteobacteria bacterium]|nr:hypothetical protein [Deltaproteobacteria bacterium]MBW2123443.1 hypothetical protein [Deltaproteobacteria bacterium]